MAVIPVSANTPFRIVTEKSVRSADHVGFEDGSWLLAKYHVRRLDELGTIIDDYGYYDAPLVNGHPIAVTIPSAPVDSKLEITTYFRLSPEVMPLSDEQAVGPSEILLPYDIGGKELGIVWNKASWNRSKYSVAPFNYDDKPERLSETVDGNVVRVALEEEYVISAVKSPNAEVNYGITYTVNKAPLMAARSYGPTFDFAQNYGSYSSLFKYIAAINNNRFDVSSLPTPYAPYSPYGNGDRGTYVSPVAKDFAADSATQLLVCQKLGYTGVSNATVKTVTNIGVIYGVSGGFKIILASAQSVLTAITCSGTYTAPLTTPALSFRDSPYYHPSGNVTFQTAIDLWRAIWDLGLLPAYPREYYDDMFFADEIKTQTALCNALGYLNYVGSQFGTHRSPNDNGKFYYTGGQFVKLPANILNRHILDLHCAGKTVAVIAPPPPPPPPPPPVYPLKPATGSFVDRFRDNLSSGIDSRAPEIGLSWIKYNSQIVPSITTNWDGQRDITSTTLLAPSVDKAAVVGTTAVGYSPLYTADFAELRAGPFGGMGCYQIYFEYLHSSSTRTSKSGVEICLYTKNINGVAVPGIIFSCLFNTPGNTIDITAYYRSGTGDMDVYSDQDYVRIPVTLSGQMTLSIPALVGANFFNISTKNYEPSRGNRWSDIELKVNEVILPISIPYYNLYTNGAPGLRLRRAVNSDAGATAVPAIANYFVYDVSSNAVGTAPELLNVGYNYSDSTSRRRPADLIHHDFSRTGPLAAYGTHSWQGPHWKDAVGSSALYVNELAQPDFNFADTVRGAPYYFANNTILANTLNLSLFGTRTARNVKAAATLSYMGIGGVGGVAVRATQAAGGHYRDAANNVGYAAVVDHSGNVTLMQYIGERSTVLGTTNVGSPLGRISLLASNEAYTHTLKFNVIPSGGSFTINGIEVAYNATASGVKALLEGVYGADQVDVEGSLATLSGITITFLDEVVAELLIDASNLFYYGTGDVTNYHTALSVTDANDNLATWFHPEYATSKNDVGAIIDYTDTYVVGNTGTPNSLLFDTFRLQLPEECRIDGIELSVRLKSLMSATIANAYVKLQNNHVDLDGGYNLQVTNTVWPDTFTNLIAGGDTYLFGSDGDTILRDFVESDAFGFRLNSITAAGIGEVDSISARIYYRPKYPVYVEYYRTVTQVPQRLSVTWNYSTIITKTFPFANPLLGTTDVQGLDQGHTGLIGSKVRYSNFEFDWLNQHAIDTTLPSFNSSARGGPLGVSYLFGDLLRLPSIGAAGTGSVPFNGEAAAYLSDLTSLMTGTVTTPGVKKSRKRILLSSFTSAAEVDISPPEFTAQISALLPEFTSETGDPLSRVSYGILLVEQAYDRVDLSILRDTIAKRGEIYGGGNCANLSEYLGGQLVESTPFEPNPMTFRSQYYYNTTTNQLFKKIIGKHQAFWKCVSQ